MKKLEAVLAKDRAEKVKYLRDALEASGWSLCGAARLLEMPVSTFEYRLFKYPELDEERLRKARGRSRTGRPRLVASPEERKRFQDALEGAKSMREAGEALALDPWAFKRAVKRRYPELLQAWEEARERAA